VTVSDTWIRPGERYTADEGATSMTGVQALVRLAVNVRRADRAAGRDAALFIAGYEGSPLAGYDLELQRHADVLAAHDVVFRPAVNEELAATAVQGTQLAPGTGDARVEGITGFWYGKSPGLDRASDALRHANLMGTHPRGGAVAFVGDDPSAKSSTVPGASEFLLADLGMPVLYPADPQDVLDLGRHAAAMSRASGLWVAVKIVTAVADGMGAVDVAVDRVRPMLPDTGFEHTVDARMLQPRLSEMEKTRDGARLAAARAYAHVNRLNTIHQYGSRARVGVVAAGKTYLDVRQALDRLGLDERELHARGMRVLRLGMVHPLVPAEIEDFARGLDEVIVVEEKRSFIESAIKDILYHVPDAPRIVGKTDGQPLVPAVGELDADLIAAALARRLGELGGFPTVDAWRAPRRTLALPLVSRTPYFCSGCPHNTSTKAPAGSTVGAGIGCHALVLMMEPDAVGDVLGLTQMGGEGAQWIRPAARKSAPRLVPLAPEGIRGPAARDIVAVHTTRIMGVGGTGVVTVSQILTTAARFAGLEARSLDQTGLAQKGGAVVSDIKISRSAFEAGAKAATGECDLYLGCDLLVAADPNNLAAADPDRTVACVSTTKVPTGQMIVDTAAEFPDVVEVTDRIREASTDAVFLDARQSAVTLFGTDQYANMLLTGAAFQTGALPIPATAIEQAIELNGVAVELNLQAFRRGRQAVADPAAFAGALDGLTIRVPEQEPGRAAQEIASAVGISPESPLGRLVLGRVADLIEYQNSTYARGYAEFMRTVVAVERAAVPDSTALSEAVARNLYKLMAYKDEYEVARLSLDPRVDAAASAEFGPGARISYRLHPPVLRALGVRHKITLGPWFRPVFRVPRAGKRLRGTPFDPFGRAQVRRVERELITEYRAAVDAVLPNLSPGTLAHCVEIADAPDEVRGYEDIKLAGVARFRARLADVKERCDG